MNRDEREERKEHRKESEAFPIVFLEERKKYSNNNREETVSQEDDPLPREEAVVDKGIHEEEEPRPNGVRRRKEALREIIHRESREKEHAKEDELLEDIVRDDEGEKSMDGEKGKPRSHTISQTIVERHSRSPDHIEEEDVSGRKEWRHDKRDNKREKEEGEQSRKSIQSKVHKVKREVNF